MLKRYASISLRLTLLFGVIFFCGYVLFGVGMGLRLRASLTSERYQTLSRRADRLQELLRRAQGESADDRAQDLRDFAGATGNGLVEVFTQSGTRLYPSPSKAASAFPWPAIVPAQSEQFERVRNGGQYYRVFVRPFALDGQSLYLAFAAPEAANLALLHAFWRSLLASIPLVLLASSFGGYLVSRRALRPVDRITATARSITISNLSDRLPLNESGDELQRLAETFNSMLDRLDSSVTKIKRFTADASHELRSPLAFTRTVAEVALRNPQIDETSRGAFQDIVDEAAKAAGVLEQMLTLARADADPLSRLLEPVDLGALVSEVVASAKQIAQEKGIVLTLTQLDPDVKRVRGDAATLRRLVWILLDNALNYTTAPGRIDLSYLCDANSATLIVTDTGVGISAEDLPQIFDRFYRADPSRSQVEGSGLGLSIAKWIADTHRADLSATSERGSGTSFKVRFALIDP